MAKHNDTGRWGEEAARDYLATRGWAIMGTNIECGRVEIDILASRGRDIAFVEVKTRTDTAVDPVRAVDRAKQRRLARAVDTYMRSHDIHLEPRIDVIAVVGAPDAYTVEHYEDAVRPPVRAL